MGDLAVDTAVIASGKGQYGATLSAEWEIWGPMGGYVAACALRAAGAASDDLRPAAFSCHYLGVAGFGPVELRVETRKGGRTASSHRVEVTQEGRPILDAMVWSVAETEGLEHDETVPPDVPGPGELASLDELVSEGAQRPYPFWNNFDVKPIGFEADWPPSGPRPAVWKEWLRFLPTASFEDPWVDAARCVILIDLPSWPSAHRPHAWRQPPFIAPTLDLHVAFHQPPTGQEWLLCEGTAPLSTAGLFGWSAAVWSPGGRLHASGGGQCLYRRIPGSPPTSPGPWDARPVPDDHPADRRASMSDASERPPDGPIEWGDVPVPVALTEVPLHDLLGLRVVQLEDPVTVEMPVAPGALNSSGNLHGGAIATLVDVAAGTAAARSSGFEPGRNTIVTADLHVRYLARPRTSVVRGEARLVRAGRQLVVIECRILDGEDRLLAVADFSAMVVPLREPLEVGGARPGAGDIRQPDI